MQVEHTDKSKTSEPIRTNVHKRRHPALALANGETEFTANTCQLILTPTAASKIFGWLYASEIEVTVMGEIIQHENGFYVDEVMLFKQDGSSGSSEVDEEDQLAYMLKCVEEEREPNCRFYCHSHPGMSSNFSPKDDRMCEKLLTDYLLSLCVADNYKVKARFDLRTPTRIRIDDIPVLISDLPETLEGYGQQVDEKVHRYHYTSSASKGSFFKYKMPKNIAQPRFFNQCDGDEYQWIRDYGYQIEEPPSAGNFQEDKEDDKEEEKKSDIAVDLAFSQIVGLDESNLTELLLFLDQEVTAEWSDVSVLISDMVSNARSLNDMIEGLKEVVDLSAEGTFKDHCTDQITLLEQMNESGETFAAADTEPIFHGMILELLTAINND